MLWRVRVCTHSLTPPVDPGAEEAKVSGLPGNQGQVRQAVGRLLRWQEGRLREDSD